MAITQTRPPTLSHVVWHLHGSPDHNANKLVFDVYSRFFDDGTGLLPLPASKKSSKPVSS